MGSGGGGGGVMILDRFSYALTWLYSHQLQNAVYHVWSARSLKNNNNSQIHWGISVRKGKFMAPTITNCVSKYNSKGGGMWVCIRYF
jgi:hypothetical protein